MLLYPGLTLLDLIGPQTTLSHVMDVHLVWKSRDEPVVSDTAIRVLPTTTFDDCPRDLDVLFVPGGPGMSGAITDADTREFLADRGSRATWVTSVCTGSIVLGAAGLLRGYRATSHWGALDLLPLVGAEPVRDQRVVIDRNRITAGGVTAGIDFGLTLVARMMGDRVAKTIQLALEYDPHPPYDAGTPFRPDADAALVESVRSVLKEEDGNLVAALGAAGVLPSMDAAERRS
jgi:transcriptional regulator GlxA family with amidase domain